MKLFELAELRTRGSVRFSLGLGREGFAVLDATGTVRAYLNVCPHRAQPVDVGDGRLWLDSGQIECQAHGARFDPSTGACLGGPCDGSPLTPLAVERRDREIWLTDDATALLDVLIT
ncbi:MAG: Rieske 2Fe-2S domain-containing protein [Deltaproteobacteria bacterium]|nr:MAG: Rieske 2Fe-2S domain-containing protein [Deltaproteobacteria bacterium]